MTGITDQLDRLLQDEKNFSTRSGLRFMTELVRSAFDVLDKANSQLEENKNKDRAVESRLKQVEDWQTGFTTLRATEQTKAEAERTFYRRAVIGGIIAIVLSETARWVLPLLR